MSSASQDNRVSATLSLMHAASEGDVQTMKTLLAGTVDVNATNQGGQTALMLAALMGHSEIVTLLLAAGADAGSRDRLGLSALDWSQRRGFPQVTQLLAGVSPNIIRPKPKSPSDSTQEKSKTEFRTAIAQELHPKDLPPASKAAPKTLQTEQSAEAQAEVMAERPAPADEPELPERVTSFESSHASEVAISAPPPLETVAVGNEAPIEAPILEIGPEPQAPPTAEAPDPTPEPLEVSTSSERPSVREVTAESAPPVSETTSVETEEPILEIRPEPQSQPAVQQPPDLLPATPIALPEEPQPSKPQILLAAPAKPLEKPRQEEEDETLTRASDPGLTPKAPSPAAASAIAETLASESPRMRAARLAATAQPPPAFETSTLGISTSPTVSDSADVGELKHCPKCNTVYPNALFSYCPRDYARLITDAELHSVSEPPPASTPITVWLLIAFVLGSSAFAAYKLTAYLWQTEPPKPVASKPAEQPPPEVKTPAFSVSGALAGLEVSIPEPEYPDELQSAGVGGPITVRIRVNRNGRVISATSSSGDRRLRTAAVQAATQATFSPEKIAEVSQRRRVVSGSITYVFAPTTTGAASPSSPTTSTTNSGVDSGATSSNESGAATPADPNSPVVSDPLTNAVLSVPAAEYPSRAKRAGIGGTITVTVRVNRAGKVVSWRSSSGDSQLRAAAIKAARKATFSREKLPGTGDVLGDITYNFTP